MRQLTCLTPSGVRSAWPGEAVTRLTGGKPSTHANASSKEEPVSDPTRSGCDSDEDGGSDGQCASDDPSTGPVPRICMDYFYVPSTSAVPIVGAQGLSTRELRHKLKELGKSTLGARNVSMKR